MDYQAPGIHKLKYEYCKNKLITVVLGISNILLDLHMFHSVHTSFTQAITLLLIQIYGIPSQFKMFMAWETNENFMRFLLKMGALSLRPDLNISKAELRGWVRSFKIFLAFFFTKFLWISERGFWGLPMILLASRTTRLSFALSFTLMCPYHETILKKCFGL